MNLTNFQKVLIIVVVVAIIVIIVAYSLRQDESTVECKGDDDCSGSNVCSGGKCVQCAFDSDCPGAQTCQSNKCVSPPIPPVPECADCNALTQSSTVFDFNTSTDPTTYFWDGDVQSDGKIVVIGRTHVTRYNTDGTRDLTFGTNGWTSINLTINSFLNGSNALEIDANDNIYIASSGGLGNSATHVVKLLPNGAPDTSFGTNGICAILNTLITGATNSITLDDDGNIYLLPNFQGKIAKVTPAGVLDTSFGINGVLDLTFNGVNVVGGLRTYKVLHYNGALYITARYNANTFVGFMKYNTDGTKDTTYGTNGDAIFDVSSLGGLCIKDFSFYGGCGIDPQGNAYLGGALRVEDPTCTMTWPYAIIKFTPSGQVDTSYGTNGVFQDLLPSMFTTGLYSEDYSQYTFDPCTGNLMTAIVSYQIAGDISYVLQVTPQGTAISNATYDMPTAYDTFYRWASFPHPDGYLVVIGEKEDPVSSNFYGNVELFACPNINYRKSTRPW